MVGTRVLGESRAPRGVGGVRATRAWELWECVSPSQWLSWKCGLGRVAASEHIRAAIARTRLPAVHQALREGHITWSKVREITRVATRESEPDWLELALAGTANHIERVVRAFRRVTPADVEQQHADRVSRRKLAA